MKLVAIVHNTNHKYNSTLIGDIIIVDSNLTYDINYNLCYKEVEHDRHDKWKRCLVGSKESFLYRFMVNHNLMKHCVTNIEIIGVL